MIMFKAALVTLAITSSGATGSAYEVCDLTDLPCWDGGKCNIKFRNQTGLGSGSGNSYLEQESLAMPVRVTARNTKGRKTGNGFWINAGASKTINLEKKDDLSWLRVKTRNPGVHAIRMYCADIRKVLRGNGTCKVYYGYVKDAPVGSQAETLAYSCDGGSVNGTYN